MSLSLVNGRPPSPDPDLKVADGGVADQFQPVHVFTCATAVLVGLLTP